MAGLTGEKTFLADQAKVVGNGGWATETEVPGDLRKGRRNAVFMLVPVDEIDDLLLSLG